MGFAIFLFFTFFNAAGAETKLDNFKQARKYLAQNLDLYDHKTIYCGCVVNENAILFRPPSRARAASFQGYLPRNHDGKPTVDLNSCGYKVQSNQKRAAGVEWEHVVPAQAFGQSFIEWREGGPVCVKNGKKFKGRKCAETNSQFNKMEADLYNLFPEVGELNGLRSNFSMAALTGSDRDFGGCQVKIQDRKFEPQEASKGIVARTYLNFDHQYPDRGVVSNKNRPLFEAWDKQHPVTELECRRWKAFEPKNGYRHLFADRCH